MSRADQARALRGSAGLSRASHVALALVEDIDALDFLQSVSTHSPYIREGRVRQALLLREDASLFADVMLVRVQDRFLVIAEGPTEPELLAWLNAARERSPKTKRTTVRGIGDAWTAIGVDGPFAWEVVAGLLGAGVLGQPYLSLLRREEVLCLRAGKTGEYGYLLLVPSGMVEETLGRLRELGGPLDLASVSLEALDACALESGHFSMRVLRETTLASPLTPLELQLQARVEYGRDFFGAAALRARREAGAKVRATYFVSDAALLPGQKVRLADVEVGEVLAAMSSPTLGGTVGLALLETRFAHPHLTLTAANDASARLLTRTAFLVDSLSLRVQPHKHAYASRDVVLGSSA